jgi:pimeloyl-ACP methyl ester carboxylesterase
MDKTIHVGETSVFYRDEGAGSGMLILHGWGSRSDTWQITQNELANRGYRVVVPDLPGFGQSGEPPAAWGLKEYSEFVHQFAQTVGLESFLLVGHSFGGRIAIDYTLRYSSQVEKLVLCGAAGITRHRQAKINLFGLVTKLGAAIFSVRGLSFLRPFTRRVWYFFVQEQDYYKASPRMQEVMRKVLDENLRSYLPRITQHTLLLWGQDDLITPLADGRLIHETIPLTHLHIFPHAHHALQLEVPLKVAAHIARFAPHAA